MLRHSSLKPQSRGQRLIMLRNRVQASTAPPYPVDSAVPERYLQPPRVGRQINTELHSTNTKSRGKNVRPVSVNQYFKVGNSMTV